MQNPAGLKLVQKRAPIEDQVDHWVAEEITLFAWYVAIARAISRDSPELLQGKSFPKHLKAAYARFYDDDPDTYQVEDPFTPEAREEARRAILEARRA